MEASNSVEYTIRGFKFGTADEVVADGELIAAQRSTTFGASQTETETVFDGEQVVTSSKKWEDGKLVSDDTSTAQADGGRFVIEDGIEFVGMAGDGLTMTTDNDLSVVADSSGTYAEIDGDRLWTNDAGSVGLAIGPKGSEIFASSSHDQTYARTQDRSFHQRGVDQYTTVMIASPDEASLTNQVEGLLSGSLTESKATRAPDGSATIAATQIGGGREETPSSTVGPGLATDDANLEDQESVLPSSNPEMSALDATPALESSVRASDLESGEKLEVVSSETLSEDVVSPDASSGASSQHAAVSAPAGLVAVTDPSPVVPDEATKSNSSPGPKPVVVDEGKSGVAPSKSFQTWNDNDNDNDPVSPSIVARPACVSAVLDPDGDGLGLENGKICRIVRQPEAALALPRSDNLAPVGVSKADRRADGATCLDEGDADNRPNWGVNPKTEAGCWINGVATKMTASSSANSGSVPTASSMTSFARFDRLQAVEIPTA